MSDDAFADLLYPMLSGRPQVDAAVLAELALAPLDKAAESQRLRDELLGDDAGRIVGCAGDIAARIQSGGRVLACGNGGSATAAADMVEELAAPPPPHAAIPALTIAGDVAILSAIANDVSFDDTVVRELIALGRPEDVLVAISTSGSSENLVRGVREAKRRGMLTVALCGYDGGRLRSESPVDHCFVVRSSSVHRIQEVQATLHHLLIELLRRRVEEEPACA